MVSSITTDVDLNTRHLRALLAVARYRNFAAAAADLGVTQPTLTRTVRKAEDILGADLFNRTTRRVSLTAVGQEFMPLAERLLSDLSLGLRNIRELAEVERGQIIIATLMTIAHGILPTAIARFADRYPSIAVDLRESVQAHVLEEVRNGAADFGLGDMSEIGGPLKAERLGENSFRVALPKGHDLLRRKTLTMKDLDGERLISMPTEAAARRALDAAGVAVGVTLNSHFTVGQFTTAFRLVSEGLGVAIVPETFFAGPYPADVASRPLRAAGAVQRLGIISRRDRAIAPAAAVFLSILRESWPSARSRRPR
jgi:DNA-binding transcriptional LysR family regulator